MGTKVSAFTADTTPTSDDLIMTVNAPGGTPGSRKVTIANLFSNAPTDLISGQTGDTSPSSDDQFLTLNDPSGTPALKKVTIANLFSNAPDTTFKNNVIVKFGDNEAFDLYTDGNKLILLQMQDVSSGNIIDIASDTNKEMTASSGSQTFLSLEPAVNQTGTAGYTALKVDATETSTGSGDNYLLYLSVGGSYTYYVSNTGNMVLNGTASFGTDTDNSTASEIHGFTSRGGKMTSSTSNQVFLGITPDVNQSGTASYTAVDVDVTESGTGSGANKLLNLAVGSTSKLNVDTTGALESMGGIILGDSVPITLGADSDASLEFDGSSLVFQQKLDIAAGDVFVFNSDTDAELTDDDGDQIFLSIRPEINQSGTAGYTALAIDATETGTGSGSNALLTLGVGGTNKFRIRNDGATLFVSNAYFNTSDSFSGYRLAVEHTGNPQSIYCKTGLNLGWTGDNSNRAAFVYINKDANRALTATTTLQQSFLSIEGEVDQSDGTGTPGYYGLFLNATETSLGSGTNKLVEAQVDSATKFSVDNKGDVTYNNLLVDRFPRRAEFGYTDADTITISSARYWHKGTTEQIVWWDSQLSYDFSSLSTDTWSYLYIDDSAVVSAATGCLTSSELTDSTTAPSWDEAKGGWYNGDDLCIFAVRGDGSGNITIFEHDGGDYVGYDGRFLDRSLGTITDSTWTDVTLTLPGFCTKSQVNIYGQYIDAGGYVAWRTNGSSDSNGHTVGRYEAGTTFTFATVVVTTDSSQKIEVYSDPGNNNNKVGVTTSGFYLPSGM